MLPALCLMNALCCCMQQPPFFINSIKKHAFTFIILTSDDTNGGMIQILQLRKLSASLNFKQREYNV